MISRLADVTVQRVEKLKINYWGNLHYTALEPLKCYLGLFKTNKAKNYLEDKSVYYLETQGNPVVLPLACGRADSNSQF